MITKSPSGALSPYYYKGGYFHGIHYGSYFEDSQALLSMIKDEEHFILNSPQKRRVLIDLYETRLTKELTLQIVEHIERMKHKIVKLAITTDKRSLHRLQKAFRKKTILGDGQLYFCPDMEEAKTWLVCDHCFCSFSACSKI